MADPRRRTPKGVKRASGATEAPPELAELAADFTIEREIGRGGTAVVYLARDRTLERRVAVKVIRGRYATDDDLVARMDREARLAARLHHPNIVGLHAVRRLRHGSLALIMQYVDGETVRQLLARGPLPIDRAAAFIGDIARALATAHAAGIVHRDVKPENIYVDGGADGEGRALLADFGAAVPLDADARLTVAGMTIGTPGYMAPELVAGGDATPQSDIYSLGLVGWEMLTGWQPWEGESLFEVLAFRKSGKLPRIDEVLPEVPASIATALNGALHPDPEERWPDAEAMVRALHPRAARTMPRGPRPSGSMAAVGAPTPSVPIAEQPTIRYTPAMAAEAVPPAAPASAMPEWLAALRPSAAERALRALRRPRVVAVVGVVALLALGGVGVPLLAPRGGGTIAATQREEPPGAEAAVLPSDLPVDAPRDPAGEPNTAVAPVAASLAAIPASAPAIDAAPGPTPVATVPIVAAPDGGTSPASVTPAASAAPTPADAPPGTAGEPTTSGASSSPPPVAAATGASPAAPSAALVRATAGRRPAAAAGRWTIPAWVPFFGEEPPIHLLPVADQLGKKVPHPPALVGVWQHGERGAHVGDVRSLVLAADGSAWLAEERRTVDARRGVEVNRGTHAGRWEVRHRFGRPSQLCTAWRAPVQFESCDDLTVVISTEAPNRPSALGFAGRHWRPYEAVGGGPAGR